MKSAADMSIIERIGLGRDEWLVLDSSYDRMEDAGLDSAMDGTVEEEPDNLFCDADFDHVSEGYSGTEGYMRGVLSRFRKGAFDRYSQRTGTYSADGMYRMESARGATAYLGSDGRAKCIAIPQCKMMNSTVIDGDHVRQKVYTGTLDRSVKGSNGSFGASGMQGRNGMQWLAAKGFRASGTHTPFDVWCVAGAVFGKALRVWRGPAGLDLDRMPCWMYVELSEVFEALNPGCRWVDLSRKSRLVWQHGIVDAFSYLRGTAMAWDLPAKGGGRTAHWTRGILESSMVSRRVDGSDEQECRQEWGDVYEPCGFKVRVRGNMVFDFCWRRGLNSPSVVQIRECEHDVSKVLGTKGWTRCFHMLWASWLVQYRNYWKRRDGGFATCDLEWSQRGMLAAFDGGVFEIRHLSTEEMVGILDYHTQQYVFSHGERRPAHIDRVFVVRRCVVGWTLPRTLRGEAVIVKNEAGMNMSLEEAGIASVPAEVSLARSRMAEVNRSNSEHTVTLDGRQIDASESVIYRCERDLHGDMQVVAGKNGRCYSMRGGIQSLGKEDRHRVLIDGHAVSEVDYSALHPNMLYAMNGIQFNGDVYSVGSWYRRHGLGRDEARLACKMMLLRVINARSRAVAMYSFKKEWNAMHGAAPKAYIPWLYELFDAIRRRHVAIAHEFCTGKGVYLMNLDGRLIREVCHRLAREHVCALAVHDSVVVDSRHARKAAGIMREEYERMFNGFTITVKR